MTVKCKILNLFNTTIGRIAIIGFFEDSPPYIGMILLDNKGNTWKIKGLAISKKEALDGESHNDYKFIWDCNLEPINHQSSITKGDFLFYDL